MKNAKIRKIVAISAATSMVLVPANVFAADTESTDGATNAGSTIEGSGSVEEFINKDVFKVTLPTCDIDFTPRWRTFTRSGTRRKPTTWRICGM